MDHEIRNDALRDPEGSFFVYSVGRLFDLGKAVRDSREKAFARARVTVFATHVGDFRPRQPA